MPTKRRIEMALVIRHHQHAAFGRNVLPPRVAHAIHDHRQELQRPVQEVDTIRG